AGGCEPAAGAAARCGGARPAAGAGEGRAAPAQCDTAYRECFFCGGARPPLAAVTAYIDGYRDQFGVGPICRVLSGAGVPAAASTYYAARARPPSARSVRDAQLAAEIKRVW